MSDTTKNKKACVKCTDVANTNGLFMCDGCHNMFCARHVGKHRDELNSQLENVVHEHNLIQEQLNREPSNHSLMKEIDRWEQITIIKIKRIRNIITIT